MHPDLEPLSFLLGRWEGAGIGGYPTIESFRFGQEISFSHNGKPFLIYTSRTWRLDEEGRIGPPLGTESGYWRPRPDHQVEVMLAHPTGSSRSTWARYPVPASRWPPTWSPVPRRPRRSPPGTASTGWWARAKISPTPMTWPRWARSCSPTCRPSSSASAPGNSGTNKEHKISPRATPERHARAVAGTDWTRSASPETRCLPGFSPPPPRTSCRRVGG